MLGPAFAIAALVALGQAPSAEQLFQKGRVDLDGGRVEQACGEFEQSYELERALGTLLNMADCDQRLGHLASAYSRFVEAAEWAARNGEDKREKVARGRASALESRVARLSISAPAGVAVTLDGELVDTQRPAVVDAGPHTVSATAPGRQSWSQRFDAQPGAQALAVPPLAALDAPQALTLEPRAEPPPPTVSRSPFAPVAVGGGAVLLAAGAVGILYSLSVNAAVARQQPGGPDAANPTVTRAQYTSLSTLYPLSWLVAVGGSALIGGGIYLATHPSEATP